MSTTTEPTDAIRLAFVCVRNAGRSQMSAAIAERERDRRDLAGRVEIRSGGTDPADRVHETVREVMAADGYDCSDRVPREISPEELRSCEYVLTMGCSTLDIEDADAVDVRDWALSDPHGRDPTEVRRIRDEIERKVNALFDEIERALEP
ncbi:low molecular weight phosphatase family protein [Natrarchaeobius halalkaliphilus]|uniref:Low molecular weight phosphatase family protein n=1 Tax=Natrarchaeobius halalkaliphilus TaxID=1679091 RepID=A0A3N6MC19_9EURY|nr:low molecular weight phosphatase family protein [Natrarchaeobius halalkaliphilus]RQG93031.1 low molecular weight phosphatase family protein [Natrarchaeobius halalkaliphilus]